MRTMLHERAAQEDLPSRERSKQITCESETNERAPRMLQRSMEKRRTNEGGFTLIELLVVIVILGILAAIVVFAIGGLSSTARERLQRTPTPSRRPRTYYASPSAGDPNTPNRRTPT